MGTRVLVTLRSGADQPATLGRLAALGAESVQPPQPELPDVCVAVVDEAAEPPEEWARRAAALPGVDTAEVDRMRFSF